MNRSFFQKILDDLVASDLFFSQKKPRTKNLPCLVLRMLDYEMSADQLVTQCNKDAGRFNNTQQSAALRPSARH